MLVAMVFCLAVSLLLSVAFYDNIGIKLEGALENNKTFRKEFQILIGCLIGVTLFSISVGC